MYSYLDDIYVAVHKGNLGKCFKYAQEEGVFQRKASIRMYLGKPIVWFSGGLEIQMG